MSVWQMPARRTLRSASPASDAGSAWSRSKRRFPSKMRARMRGRVLARVVGTSIRFAQVVGVAIRVGEEGDPDLRVGADGVAEADAALRQFGDDLVNGLINRKAELGGAGRAGLGGARADGVEPDVGSIGGGEGGPVAGCVHGEFEAERVAVEGDGAV